ncbi:MAG: type IX secretion system membrane protein PorP/SprF [Bacteroidia bacterium]
MKKVILGGTFLLSIFCAHAQQDPLKTLYYYNSMLVNPAYTGTLDYYQAIGGFRSQWLAFPGAPQTANMSIHGPLPKENMGLGLTFTNDRAGVIQSNNIQLTYAYRLTLKNSNLSFGLQSGLRNFSATLNDVFLTSSDQNYDAAFANNINAWSLNFGTGVFWYSDKWFAGLSLPHLRNHILADREFKDFVDARYRTQFQLHGGYVFDVAPELKLKPAAMIKGVGGAPLQLDLNATLYWNDLLSGGLAFRTGDALSFYADVKLSKNFRCGYAYDQVVNGWAGTVGGSHEIMLRYDFSLKGNEIKYRVF